MAADLPPVSVFDAAKATPEEIINALKIAGGCVVRNFLSKETCAKIDEEVRPHLAPVPGKGKSPDWAVRCPNATADEEVPVKPAGLRDVNEDGITNVFDECACGRGRAGN
jgi:hypothetical protein